MAWDLSLLNVLGLAAGALVILVGAFVLAARPQAWLHRLFFLLALVDGVGTILTRLRSIVPETAAQAYFQELGWYVQIATLTVTVVFAILFPRPILDMRVRIAALVAAGLAAALFLGTYFVVPTLHWRGVVQNGKLTILYGPLGAMEHVAVVLATAAVAYRLTMLLRRDPSASHARQAALFLAGFLLNEAPYATTDVASGARSLAAYLAPSQPWYAWLDHAARLAVVGVLLGCVAMLLTSRRADRVAERRVVLLGYLGVLAITLAAALAPSAPSVRLFRIFGLVAYPLVLGYAIMRYELFDINAQLRRAATVSLALVGLAGVFAIVENVIQNALQETVFGGIPSGWVSGSAAAIAAAGLSVPIVAVSRKVGKRVVPELTQDEVHRRKLEVYKHSLEGALADGILNPGESRTLAALRETLGLTMAEHDALLAQVRPLAAAPG